MRLPHIPARWHLPAVAAILGALAALAVLVVAAVWLYDHRNAPVLVPGAIAVLALDVGMHWANIRRWAAVRDLAERAADAASGARGAARQRRHGCHPGRCRARPATPATALPGRRGQGARAVQLPRGKQGMSVTEQDIAKAIEALWPLTRYRQPRDDEWDDVTRGQRDRVAQALAEERDRAIEPFTALADEMQHQIEFRREGDPQSLVADVRETDLRWLRLAISNAKDPR